MILTAVQQMIRDEMRCFAEERLLPKAEHWEANAEFPREALRELGVLGALGVTVPESYGGVGLDYVSLAVVIEDDPSEVADMATRIAGATCRPRCE